VGRSHFEGMKLQDTAQYLKWHLEIAGIKEHLFTEESALAIHQSSGGGIGLLIAPSSLPFLYFILVSLM